MYSIVGIFYVCVLALWHAVIGKFLSKPEADEIDSIMFFVFLGILVCINISFVIWFVFAYLKISQLRKKETEYLRMFREALKRDHFEQFHF